MVSGGQPAGTLLLGDLTGVQSVVWSETDCVVLIKVFTWIRLARMHNDLL